MSRETSSAFQLAFEDLARAHSDILFHLTNEPQLPESVSQPLKQAAGLIDQAIKDLEDRYGYRVSVTLYLPSS